ncbi:hypothetical protein HYH03_010593 [Edaphochlamys debaryana]|uniref:EF-hand domain-containing protein n=1 Tax=Edaphochlamys debaryana TaxID=47281 RepID=A0A835XWY5_9CHLO|nr:hypothetical protein HYH03_010593 [Edaphochlamys debaryana]|eukprot:KAG2491152.1 hypothetical protein HYH03_010593 [Edaphochlamys debaryana]
MLKHQAQPCVRRVEAAGAKPLRYACAQRRSAPARAAMAAAAGSASTATVARRAARRAPPRLRTVLCRAEATAATPMTLMNLISALAKASSAWEKYDKDRTGTLSLHECEDIFNSPEIAEAVEMITNVSSKHYTAADLEPYFKQADRDRSGTLSRTEFLALYLAVATERIKKNPLLLAEALLGFIDKDKNGVLEGGELKALLTILGFAPALLLPIPDFVKIEYKSILRALGGHFEKK